MANSLNTDSTDLCPFNYSLSLSGSILIAFHDFFGRTNGIDTESFEDSFRVTLSFIRVTIDNSAECTETALEGEQEEIEQEREENLRRGSKARVASEGDGEERKP